MCPSTACPVQKPDYVSWSCHRVLQPHSSTNAVNWSEGAVKWSGHAATPFCSFRICFSDERSKSCVSMKIKSGACIGLWVACKNVIRNRTCCFYKKNPRKLVERHKKRAPNLFLLKLSALFLCFPPGGRYSILFSCCTILVPRFLSP